MLEGKEVQELQEDMEKGEKEQELQGYIKKKNEV